MCVFPPSEIIPPGDTDPDGLGEGTKRGRQMRPAGEFGTGRAQDVLQATAVSRYHVSGRGPTLTPRQPIRREEDALPLCPRAVCLDG